MRAQTTPTHSVEKGFLVFVFIIFIAFWNVIGASRSEPHTTEFYAFRGILFYHQAIAHASNVSRKTWRRCSAHYVYAIAKKKRAQKSMLRHSYRYQRARSIEVTMVGTARSIEITKVSYHGGSSPVLLCYQIRLRVSCALCNNFQAARPRQTTERRLAPLYDKS